MSPSLELSATGYIRKHPFSNVKKGMKNDRPRKEKWITAEIGQPADAIIVTVQEYCQIESWRTYDKKEYCSFQIHCCFSAEGCIDLDLVLQEWQFLCA